jgi:spermidine/putrescine transport system permease protein
MFPRVSPFECFSVEWFRVLVNDEKLMQGLRNSLWIGLGVVLIAVPTGLAGSLMLTQVSKSLRPWYYTIVVSPILIPGVVLGISTIVFWDRIAAMFGFERGSLFYDHAFGNGIFLTVLGQSTFISAYSMLVFISRLQRFDPALEEAALDLGATHVQSFRKVLLPFLKPAIGSAAVLAFLASFENYNTTIFTIVTENTLTTELASKVRYGINPSISALAVVIVALTLLGAAVYEIMRRREAKAMTAFKLEQKGAVPGGPRKRPLVAEPALVVVLLVFIAGLGTTYFAGTVGLDQCKVAVKAEKRRITEQRIRERRAKAMFQSGAPGATPAPAAAPAAPKVEAKGTEGYQGIFAPQNLQGQVESDADEPGGDQPTGDEPGAKGTEGYQGIFDPANLKGQVGTEAPKE